MTRRGDDFPFQNIAFSIWENSEFRFKGLSNVNGNSVWP